MTLATCVSKGDVRAHTLILTAVRLLVTPREDTNNSLVLFCSVAFTLTAGEAAPFSEGQLVDDLLLTGLGVDGLTITGERGCSSSQSSTIW